MPAPLDSPVSLARDLTVDAPGDDHDHGGRPAGGPAARIGSKYATDRLIGNRTTGFHLPVGTVVELTAGGGDGYGPAADAVGILLRSEDIGEELARRDYLYALGELGAD